MFGKPQNSTIAILAAAIVAFSQGYRCPAQDRAEERGSAPIRAADKLYGGVSLEVWQKRIEELKPTSEYAAVLAPGLTEIVKDPHAPDFIRERAALTLGRIGGPAAAAVPVLGEILSDPNESLSNRIWAGRALVYFGEYASPAADPLIDFLFEEQIPLRYRAIPVEALGLIGSGHPNVLPALLRLFQYTPEGQSNLSSGDVIFLRELATEAFTMMGQDADIFVPLLMRAARDPSEAESIRRNSVIAIGRIGANAAVAIPALTESLEFDPSEAVRDEAARALAKIGEPAYPVMQRYLEHSDPLVRWRIADAIGELKSPPSNIVAALQTMITDPDEFVRITTLRSLGKLEVSRDELVPMAIQLLESEDRQIRMQAMKLVLENSPLRPSELTFLKELLSHDQPATARIASLALKKLSDAARE